MCNEWDDFEKFYSWAMSNGYDNDLTLDRIDVNGNYEPSNCRWVTYKIQANNKSNNRLLEFQGISHTLGEWSEITGISISAIWSRLNRGWSVEKTLTTKTRKQVRHGKNQ